MDHPCGPVAGWRPGRQARPCCCRPGTAGVQGRPSQTPSCCQTAAVTTATPLTSLPRRWRAARRQGACGADSLADRALALGWQPLPPKPTLHFAVTTAAPDSNVDGRSVPAVTALPLEGCWGDGLGGSASGRVTSRPTCSFWEVRLLSEKLDGDVCSSCYFMGGVDL